MRRSALESSNASHVHDTSFYFIVVFGHFWDGIFGHLNHTGNVGFHAFCPLYHIHIYRGASGTANPDIVNQNIQPTEGFNCVLYCCLTVFLRRNVCADRKCSTTIWPGIHKLNCLIRPFQIQINAYYITSVVGEENRDRTSVSNAITKAACACHNCNFSYQERDGGSGGMPGSMAARLVLGSYADTVAYI